MAGVLPIPIKGIKNPSKAKLGIAWMTFVVPIIGLDSFGCREIKMPNGIPIITATRTEIILK
jgi:hypothetical protein